MLPSHRYVGIFNQGSTCYLNAVVQTLFHLPIFRAKIYNLKPTVDSPVATALRNLFVQLELGSKSITTTELTAAFGWDRYEASIQHDVHELIQQLLDSLETAVAGGPEAAFIRDLFSGMQVYRSKAVNVNYTSDRLEDFYDIELTVQGKKSIEESLAVFVQPETIEGVSIAVTPGAQPTPHHIKRTQRLMRLPPILCVHPNRVGFDMETFAPITLRNSWTFPFDSLDLSPYMMDGDTLHVDKESQAKMDLLVKNGDDALPCGTDYELHSVLIHAGDANIGHYYCYVRLEDQWVRFNDEFVDSAEEQEVCQAAFGGKSEAHRCLPFNSERASLLVYVNKQCKNTVLCEVPASQQLRDMVKQQEEERCRRSMTARHSYFAATPAFVDVLDGVRGAFEDQLQEVLYDPNTTRGADAVIRSIAERMNVPTQNLLMFPVLFNNRVPSSYDVIVARSEPPHDSCLLFFRTVSEDLKLSDAIICQSWEGLVKAVPGDHRVYGYSSHPVRLWDEKGTTLSWCENIVAAPASVHPTFIKNILESRQFYPVRVYGVDAMNAGKTVHRFTLKLSEYASYAQLQQHIFRVIQENKLTSGGVPSSPNHIALYRVDEGTGAQEPIIAPRTAYRAYRAVDTQLGMLWGRDAGKKLFYSILPRPVDEIMTRTVVTFRIGWDRLPSVYLAADETSISFGDLLTEAMTQLGDRVPSALINRHNSHHEKCPMARLLRTVDSRIVEVITDESAIVNLQLACVYVLDPLPPMSPGLRLIDVLFCCRRSGEEYYSYPTSVQVSTELGETGSTILMRVIKKLQVPDANEAIKKWFLSVKGVNSKKIKLCDPKDELAVIVKKVEDDTFEFLVDRPEAYQLDGLFTLCPRREEKSLVIRASSIVDLSAAS